MTVSTTTRKAGPFIGNGVTTAFPFSFKVFAKTDLRVILTDAAGAETVLELDADYSVTLNADQDNNPGGSVTYSYGGAMPSTQKLTILSDVPVLQPVDIVNRGGFFPSVIEGGLDRVTILAQQVAELLGRTLRFAVSDSASNTELPTAAARAGKAIVFDENGNIAVSDAGWQVEVSHGNVIRTTHVKGVNFAAGGTQLFLPSDGFIKENVHILFGGTGYSVELQQTAFSLNGATITLASPIPNDVEQIETWYIQPLAVGSINDGVVTDAKVAANAAIDASKLNFVQAGAGAAARSVRAKLRDVVSVKDFGAVGDGVADDTAAFQAALAVADSIFVPAGTYRVSATLAKTTTKGFHIRGAGMGLTFIQQWIDADLFSISNTGGSTQFAFEDMTLQPRVMMTTGAALSIRNDTALPSLLVRNVFIGQSSTYEFKYGINCLNCTEALFDRVVQYGLGTSNFIAWKFSSTIPATTPKWFGCAVYNARYGAHILNTVSPGIEGVQFYGCDFVGVAYGVLYENAYGTGYFPPQLTWMGGHIAATSRNFDLNIMAQATIVGGLFYNSGPGPMINLNTCSDVHISNNKFFNVGAGTPTGIDIYSGTGPINLGVISNNYFGLGGGSMCMQFNAGQPIYNGQISNNVRATGAKTLNVFNGSKDSSIRLFNNTPDVEDYYDTVTLSGSTMSIAGKRSRFLGANGAGTATTMPGGYPGDTITLKCDGGLTLQHNGAAGGGFLLKGAVNFTFTSGSLITLTMANGGYWTEVSRSV
jgi:hypothetical protein